VERFGIARLLQLVRWVKAHNVRGVTVGPHGTAIRLSMKKILDYSILIILYLLIALSLWELPHLPRDTFGCDAGAIRPCP
jgi:hypothetical protein